MFQTALMGRHKCFGCCDFFSFAYKPALLSMDKDRPPHQRENCPDIADKVRDVSPMLRKALGFFFPLRCALSIPRLETLSPLLSVNLLHRAQFQFLLFHFPCHFLCHYSSYKGLPSPLLIQHFIISSKSDLSFILKPMPSLGAPVPCKEVLLNSIPVRSLLLIFTPNIFIQQLIPHLFSCQQDLLAWIALLPPRRSCLWCIYRQQSYALSSLVLLD